MSIKMIMPDFYLGTNVYDTLTWFHQHYPESFLTNRKVYSVFGAYPGMIWGGGSSFVKGEVASVERMKEDLDKYNTLFKMRLTYTFTNVLLEEKHLYDTYCNLALETIAKYPGNAILVSSPLLEDYVRKYYPNIDINKSIIGTEHQDYFPDEKYKLTVLRRSCNAKPGYFESVPKEHRKKIEILCNDPCPDNCPRIYAHYKDYARSTLEFSHMTKGIECSQGEARGDFEYMHRVGLKSYISPLRIDELHHRLGYDYFKVSGRGQVSKIIENNLEYLIKPEYQRDMREIMYNKYLR